MLYLPISQITLFNQIGLFNDLPGISEKLFPLRRQQYSFICTLKDGNTQFTFQFFDRSSQTGLCNI